MGILGGLSGIFAPGNYDSPLGAIGKPIQKATDPLSWMTGGKWADLTSTTIPRASNKVLSKVVAPFDKVDETINPVRRFIKPVDQLGDIVKNKPASAIGTAIGAFFGGGAALGAMGAGGAGGAAGGSGMLGGSAAGGSAAGYGGGVASTALPGILPGASGASVGGLGAGGSITGAGGMFGAGTGSSLTLSNIMDAYRLYNAASSLNQNNRRRPSMGV